MLICPKCGREFKKIYAWKKHIKYCVPKLSPEELHKLYRDLGLRKITDYYEEYRRPVCPERAIK